MSLDQHLAEMMDPNRQMVDRLDRAPSSPPAPHRPRLRFRRSTAPGQSRRASASCRSSAATASANGSAWISAAFVIGNERDCDLRPVSPLLSRHHCVFKRDEYAVRVRDLGSNSGTFVNGRRIHSEAILKPGDDVTVGDVTLHVDASALAPRHADAGQPTVDQRLRDPVAVSPCESSTKTIIASR